jgi:uncharacterized protein (DUF305 family)
MTLALCALPVHPAPAAGQAPTFTEADVQFMQGMIVHHQQAIAMAALVPTHTKTSALGLIARRIDVSQRDEIKLMTRWLETHRRPTRAAMDHDNMTSMPLMPGMLSTEEMAALGAATGTAFDRLFLEGMIKHHQGALVMVKDLFSKEGAAQNVEIFRFASEVDADQRAEIKRMQALLTPKRD